MVPGRSLGVPGDPPRASQKPLRTLFETRRRFRKNLKRPGHIPEPIWGLSQDPQINKKRTYGQKDTLGSVTGSVFH